MSATLKRKSDQSEVPVDWVDDNEWNAIEGVFDAISKAGTNLSMVPSILLSSAPHLFSDGLPGGQSPVPRQVPENLKQRDSHYRTVSPNGGGVPSWRNLGLPCQFSSRNNLPGGRAWTQCADQCPEFPSGDSPSGEQSKLDSRLPASPQQKLLPGACFPGMLESVTVSEDSSAQVSEIIQPDNEDVSRETFKERSVRRLPAWMEQDRQPLLLLNNVSPVERISNVLSLDGITVSRETVEDRQSGAENLQSDAGEGSIASSVQQMGNGPPAEVQLEQPQAGLPWGLQPSNCVDVIKPKFPAMQFRGQIVYSKTQSEVNAATLELWQRVHELQETTLGAVPIGFDLEWRASFERGEIPRKVAVLQLCLDGRRCDVMQIIYSGIPTALQDLLEAPSTLKVGVGVYGDASKLRQDYQISTRKLVDLRVVANQKMRNLKQWSLSSLALELTGKQVEKIPSIRCGDWEALPLSQSQLEYAATDAFASLHLYQVLASFPNPVSESTQNDSGRTNSDVEPPAT